MTNDAGKIRTCALIEEQIVLRCPESRIEFYSVALTTQPQRLTEGIAT